MTDDNYCMTKRIKMCQLLLIIIVSFMTLPRDASAESGDATVSRPSVCLSVCPSVRASVRDVRVS